MSNVVHIRQIRVVRQQRPNLLRRTSNSTNSLNSPSFHGFPFYSVDWLTWRHVTSFISLRVRCHDTHGFCLLFEVPCTQCSVCIGTHKQLSYNTKVINLNMLAIELVMASNSLPDVRIIWNAGPMLQVEILSAKTIEQDLILYLAQLALKLLLVEIQIPWYDNFKFLNFSAVNFSLLTLTANLHI